MVEGACRSPDTLTCPWTPLWTLAATEPLTSNGK